LRSAGSFQVGVSWPVRADTWLAAGAGYRRCTVLHEPLKVRSGGRTAVQEEVIGLERGQRGPAACRGPASREAAPEAQWGSSSL